MASFIAKGIFQCKCKILLTESPLYKTKIYSSYVVLFKFYFERKRIDANPAIKYFRVFFEEEIGAKKRTRDIIYVVVKNGFK